MVFYEVLDTYDAIFSSHLMYGCQIWAQNLCLVTEKMSILQKKCSKNYDFNAHSEPSLKKLDILNLKTILSFYLTLSSTL